MSCSAWKSHPWLDFDFFAWVWDGRYPDYCSTKCSGRATERKCECTWMFGGRAVRHGYEGQEYMGSIDDSEPMSVDTAR